MWLACTVEFRSLLFMHFVFEVRFFHDTASGG